MFFNNTKGSVLSAVLFHATANFSIIYWPTKHTVWYFYAVLLIVIVAILFIYGPQTLVRRRVALAAELEAVQATEG